MTHPSPPEPRPAPGSFAALAPFAPVLALALRVLDDDHHLVVNATGTPRYVQYAAFGGNLRAETSSNTYLEDPHRLVPTELRWLAAHGWNDPDQGGNHWRHWEPGDAIAASTVGLVTLHAVHGVDDPDRLHFDSGSSRVLDVLRRWHR